MKQRFLGFVRDPRLSLVIWSVLFGANYEALLVKGFDWLRLVLLVLDAILIRVAWRRLGDVRTS